MPGSQASNKVRFDDKEMTLLLTIISALGTTKQIWDSFTVDQPSTGLTS